MAATLTPSRDHTFTGLLQQPSAPSTRLQLPSTDFSFSTLREQMALFTTRFDAHITAGRARVLAERNAFRLQAAELAETSRAASASLAQLAADRSAHAALVSHEQAEREELADAVAQLTQDRQRAAAERDRIAARVDSIRAQVAQLGAERGRRARAREEQSLRNGPELRFWEQSLALRIGGVDHDEEQQQQQYQVESRKGDRVRFMFGCVDARGGSEGGFVLDMGGEEFRVTETAPVLDEDSVAEVVAAFNGGGQLSDLLKGMRGLIVKAFTDR